MTSLDCYYCGAPARPGTDLCADCIKAYPSITEANRETAAKRLIAAILRGNRND